MAAQIRKVSDKYILARFNREFEQAANDLSNQDEGSLNAESNQKSAKTTLNYLRFKEFLVKMGLLTQQQANQDCE